MVRYTGPAATARANTRSWAGWEGAARFVALTPDPSERRLVYAPGGPKARFRHKTLELLPGILVTADAPDDGSGWRIWIPGAGP